MSSKWAKIGEKRTGNIAKRRLLVNPYGPEIQTEFPIFPGENDLNWEEFTKSPPDRYVPNSSPAKNQPELAKREVSVSQLPSRHK